MAQDSRRIQRNAEAEGAVHKRQAAFQEAPGEAEADAIRDTFLQRAAMSPEGLGAALSGTGAALRGQVVSRLQQERGNGFVQRVVASAKGTPGRLVGLSQPEMVSEVLQRKGSGSPLPDATREHMEGHFGAGLGGVRVHTDDESSTLNRELDAKAFTVGSDIFFSEGAYDPHGSEGQGLLAHELTHVGQQTGFGGQAAAVQRQLDEEQPGAAGAAAPAAAAGPEEEAAGGAGGAGAAPAKEDEEGG